MAIANRHDAANREGAVRGDPSALDSRSFARSSRRIAQRDAEIVASRARGRSWPEIALEHKLSVRACQKIAKSWREDGLAVDVIDPLAEVRALIDLLGKAVEDCAALEERTRHDGVRIAATRQKIDAAFTRLELMQQLGWVPRPRVIAFEQEAQQMFREFAEILSRHNVGDDAVADVLALAERNLAGCELIGAA